MFKGILNPSQRKLLPLLKTFRRDFYLAGGTAVALQIGHRKSIDFDLFSEKAINRRSIEGKLLKNIDSVLVASKEEYTVMLSGVKITFLNYPFEITPLEDLDGFIKMPELLDLAAMKAYTIGRRNELKDYVDLFFLLRDYFTLEEIEKRAVIIFGNLFSEKLFRAQLIYFNDVDWTQKIDFMAEHPNYNQIRKFLEKLVAGSI